MSRGRPLTRWWVLVVVAVLVGTVGAVVVLLALVALTGSRALGATAGAVALVLGTGRLSTLAARRISRAGWPRRWLPVAVTGVTLVAAAVVGLLVFAPAPPYSPSVATDDTRYWELPTGSRIAYTFTPAEGAPRPTPVILVHGGPGAPDAEQERLTATLAEAGFDVYDYHQVGAGLSERLADVREYTVARHVADLEAIRATIGADRVGLVGGSWGGRLIANYLAAHPDRVSWAVVSSPAPIWAPVFADTDGLTASGRQDQSAVIANFPRFLLAHVLIRAVGPRVTHDLLPARQMDGVFQALVGSIALWSGCSEEQRLTGREAGGPAGVGFWVNAVTSRDAQRVADPRPVLRDVSTPLLVLRGECDYIAWEATREYRDLLPNAVLLAIEDAGHAIPADQPDLYSHVVSAFLRDEPLPREPYTAAASPW